MSYLWTYVIDRPLVPKARPRLAAAGNVYTPHDTKGFERVVGLIAKATIAQWESAHSRTWPQDAGYSVWISAIVPAPRRADLDNYAKAILDAMNGIAYKDDRQVVSLTVVDLGFKEPHRPGGVVTVEARPEPVRRSLGKVVSIQSRRRKR